MPARPILQPKSIALLIALLIAALTAALCLTLFPAARALAQVEPAAAQGADEQTLLLPAVADATVEQLNPDTNFGGEGELRAGLSDAGALRFATASLLRWDLSALPRGSTIHQAGIELYQTSGGTDSLLIYSVLGAWDEGAVTWNTLPDLSLYDRTWTPESAANQYVRHDLTALVEQWVNNGGNPPNQGLLLQPGGELQTRTFRSREAAAQTPPVLRVRFTLPRIRVCYKSAQTCSPAAGAEVFNQTGDPIAVTDANGLIDAGLAALDDLLWARVAVGQPDAQSTLYYTSGSPQPVNAAAFQLYPDSDFYELRLVVSADQPLLLYNLAVSAQWYLEDNPQRVEWLRSGLMAASDYLYDFTEGQFALGTVTVRQMYEGWDAADIKLLTSNVLHPNANVGGIVAAETPDIWATLPLSYTPGSVFMGSYWNRFGAPPGQEVKYGGQVVPQAEMEGDWAIALAHELGHYLLFLFDTYTDADGVSSEALAAACTGSAMGNAYLPANHALIADQARWDANCAGSEAHVRLDGRTEWATVSGWHTWAVVPATITPGVYPPVTLTHVVFVPPGVTPPPLANQVYTLDYQQNETSSGEARAFLLRDDSLIFEQGKPAKGATEVELVDARLGDRLCVFDLNDHAEGGDLPRHQWGCEPVAANDSVLSMTLDAAWNPLVTMEQTGPQQLRVTVRQPLPSGAGLRARLIPETGPALPGRTLSRSGDEWSALFDLSEPVMPLYLQLWVRETPPAPQTRREAFADRGVGGNGAYGPARLYSGVMALSSDGNAGYGGETPITLGAGQSIAWQSMLGTPPLTPWKRISGQSYRLDAFPAALVISGTVSIRYSDAFGVFTAGETGAESAPAAAIHFWDGSRWRPLPTTIGKPANAPDGVLLASAPSQGVGVYAVLLDSRPALFLPNVRR